MLSMKTRLDCPRSYATEDSPDLLCEYGDVKCNGTLYDCCLWDRTYDEQMKLVWENRNEHTKRTNVDCRQEGRENSV